MAGLSIPIGGDMAPFLAVAAQLRAEMKNLSSVVKETMSGTRTDVKAAEASLAGLKGGTSATVRGFKGMIAEAGAFGFAVTNIVSGAKALRSAFNFLKNLPSGWKKVAIAAAATGAAILGIVTAVRVVKNALGSLMSMAGRAFGAVVSSARGAASSVKNAFSGITSAIPGGSLLAPLAGIAGIAGAAALAISSLKTGAEVAGGIEQTGMALEALTGSADTAKRVLEDMRTRWIATGQTIEEQGGSIRKFIALGFSPEDAMKLNKNILDVAGAVGMTAGESTLLASALAQVKAKGIVSMEELRQQIAEKGIPVFEALAEKIGVSKGELIKMVSDGKVPAEALLDIFLNMEGQFGRFAGGAERMGVTFLGLASRLKGAWQLFLAEFMAPIIDHLRPILDSAISQLESWRDKAREAGAAIGKGLLAAFALIKGGQSLELLRRGFNVAVQGALDIFMRGLRSAVVFLAVGLERAFRGALAFFSDPAFLTGLKQVFAGMGAVIAGQLRESLAFTEEKRQRGRDLKEKGGAVMDLGASGIAAAVADRSPLDGIFDLINDATRQAKDAAGGEQSPALIAARQELSQLLKTVSGEVKTLMDGVTPTPIKPQEEAPVAAPEGKASSPIESLGTLTTSLGRIGGGGFGMSFTSMIGEARKTNTLLGTINKGIASLNSKTGLEVLA